MPVENGSELASPPAEITPVTTPAAAPVAATSDAPAASSPAKDESVLDAVKAALQPKTADSSSAPASQEAPPNPDAPSEDDDKEPEGDPTNEELARYHSKTRKRMSKLMGERNEARDEVEKLRPDAEVGSRITSYIAESGMTSDEANLLLEVGRNMKRDPLKAWEQLKPYVAALQKMVGEVLPEDLQSAVTKGEITEPYARQIARGRTETTVLSHQTRAQDEDIRRRDAARSAEQLSTNVSTTISTWESTQAKNDPDWNLKQSRIGELIELEVRRNGFPKTAKAALDIAEKAKTAVNAELARFQPRPLAVNSVNPASSARAAAPQPTSAVEAAKLALRAG